MRQMAVMDANDDDIESWITVKGNHIPIKKGQSKEDAVKSFVEKKGGSGEKKAEPKSNKQVFYKNISGKQIGSPKGRTFIENEIMTEKEMAKRGFDPTDKRFERKELGKNEHHFFFGARFENEKKSEKKESAPKENETDKLYNEIGEYMKANKLPIDEQEHLIALRKMLKNDVNSTEHVKRNFEKWFSNKKQQQTKETSAKKSDSRLVNAVATALGRSVEEAESEIEGAAQYIHDLIKAKDLRNGDVEETLRGLGVEPDYADEFMQWATYPRRKKK